MRDLFDAEYLVKMNYEHMFDRSFVMRDIDNMFWYFFRALFPPNMHVLRPFNSFMDYVKINDFISYMNIESTMI